MVRVEEHYHSGGRQVRKHNLYHNGKINSTRQLFRYSNIPNKTYVINLLAIKAKQTLNSSHVSTKIRIKSSKELTKNISSYFETSEYGPVHDMLFQPTILQLNESLLKNTTETGSNFEKQSEICFSRTTILLIILGITLLLLAIVIVLGAIFSRIVVMVYWRKKMLKNSEVSDANSSTCHNSQVMHESSQISGDKWWLSTSTSGLRSHLPIKEADEQGMIDEEHGVLERHSSLLSLHERWSSPSTSRLQISRKDIDGESSSDDKCNIVDDHTSIMLCDKHWSHKNTSVRISKKEANAQSFIDKETRMGQRQSSLAATDKRWSNLNTPGLLDHLYVKDSPKISEKRRMAKSESSLTSTEKRSLNPKSTELMEHIFSKKSKETDV